MTSITTASARHILPLLAAIALTNLPCGPTSADETGISPHMTRIVGQEDFVHVWTRGVAGVGDEQDKLVTIDVNPSSPAYGKVVNALSAGGRNGAHSSGLTDDRRFLWATGLKNSRIFIFDLHSDPAKPRLHGVIEEFVVDSGGVMAPRTGYALPDRMLLSGLTNLLGSGQTALVEYTNSGEYVAAHWMPTDENLQGALKSGRYADGFGYDVRALPRRNVLLTSSFTDRGNLMGSLDEVLADEKAMQRFGNTIVVWDLHTRRPRKVLDVPGAPLGIRCAWGPRHDYCFTSTALTAKLWLIYADDAGEWQARAVADIGDAGRLPLPVSISIFADDTRLWIDTWNDGTARLFDISDPHAPRQIYSERIGAQVNMVSQSWDGSRVYFTSALLTHWDKTESPDDADLQYFKAYDWDGEKLRHRFSIDFHERGLGSPQQMRFSAYALYDKQRPAAGRVSEAGRE